MYTWPQGINHTNVRELRLERLGGGKEGVVYALDHCTALKFRTQRIEDPYLRNADGTEELARWHVHRLTHKILANSPITLSLGNLTICATLAKLHQASLGTDGLSISVMRKASGWPISTFECNGPIIRTIQEQFSERGIPIDIDGDHNVLRHRDNNTITLTCLEVLGDIVTPNILRYLAKCTSPHALDSIAWSLANIQVMERTELRSYQSGAIDWESYGSTLDEKQLLLVLRRRFESFLPKAQKLRTDRLNCLAQLKYPSVEE